MTHPVAPPQNLDAERELLGAMLCFYRPELVHIAQAAGLKRGDFYRHAHEVVYRAILVLHGRGGHVDALTVARFLGKERTRETPPRSFLEVIGEAQLELLCGCAAVNGFRERCVIVHEDGRWRRWLTALYDAQECVHCRDDAGFWSAVARLREDVPAGAELPRGASSLRVVRSDVA